MISRLALRLWVAAHGPALVGTGSLAGLFAGLWLWLGLGPALTVVCGLVFAAVSWTHVRGGYG